MHKIRKMYTLKPYRLSDSGTTFNGAPIAEDEKNSNGTYLSRRKATTGWPGTSKITGITMQFTSNIHQNKLAFSNLQNKVSLLQS